VGRLRERGDPPASRAAASRGLELPRPPQTAFPTRTAMESPRPRSSTSSSERMHRCTSPGRRDAST
jgi:hypothetical protein